MSREYRFEPPTDFEITEPTSCYNCENDCMGIILLMFQEGDH